MNSGYAMQTEKKFLMPESTGEALKMALASGGSFKYVAGGTDVMVNRFQANETSRCLIDLSRIQELRKVEKDGGFLTIGAMVCLDELEHYAEISSEFPALIEAAASVGSPLVRSSATLGGNILCENRCSYYNQSGFWREAVGFCLKCEGDICIATGSLKLCYSKFVSDTAPALICLDARIQIADEKGTDVLPLDEIYTGDGVQPVSLPKTAIVKKILLPLNQGFKAVFKKLRQRESLDFSSLTTCVSLNNEGKLKISLGGVDPKPVTLAGDAKSNHQELIEKAYKKCRAIDNDTYPRAYRKDMIKTFLNKSFEELGL